MLCGSAAAAVLPPGFTESLVAGGLTNPTAMEFAPDGRLFVCLQAGQVRVIKDGALLPDPFLTLTVNSDGERGLLGIAFDPAFSSNHYVYLYYTATPQVHNRVSRFTADGDVVVPGSEVALLDFNAEPLSGSTNHNGGAIHFGVDGKLYVAVGDNAVQANAQTFSNRLGKILRVNSDGTIPADNPFFSSASGLNKAIWALGVRNPFTFAVQPMSGRIFINDVGESTWEEINDGSAGRNFGWPACEGPNAKGTEVPCTTDFDAPFFAYDHRGTGECAIAGGTFYNPLTAQFPAEFTGQYFFADLCGGWIRRLNPATGVMSQFATGIASPVDLKVSSDGSLFYLARGGGGAVYRIDVATPTAHAGAMADFDGNGVDDLAVYRPATGTWRVHNQFEIQFGDAGDIPVPGDYNGDGTTDLAVYRPSTRIWYIRNLMAVQFGDVGDIPVPGDYDGDGFTDIAVYRPTTGFWFVRNQFAVQFGDRGDVPVPADYNGDGAAEVAVYRPRTGTWYVRNQFVMVLGGVPVPGDYDGDGAAEPAGFYPSHGLWVFPNDEYLQFGERGDVPVPRDYNGDGRTDIAVYRPSTATWFVRNILTVQFGNSDAIVVPRAPVPRATPGDYDGNTATDVAVYRPSTGYWYVSNQLAVQFGMAGDLPVPADYNGDGTIDIATYRPSLGRWLVRNQFEMDFGEANDVPVPGDYTGDRLTDLAVYRPSTGEWHVRGLPAVLFGDDGDIPMPADYDGDGITDIAVYRPSTGMWFVRNLFAVQFGDSADIPVPADYDGDGVVDIAVYRPSTGVWHVRNQFAVQFGDPGDVPVAGEYVNAGVMDLAVYRPSTGQWFVRNAFAVQFGDPADVPVVRVGRNP
jgi:glucose/arabinose dehydrogenase